MPYDNEHAARLKDPDSLDPVRVRRTSGSGDGTVQGIKIPDSIDIIWFIIISNGKEVPIAQALRFPTKDWTEAEARKWLKDNKIKFILFEPAEKKKEFRMQNKIFAIEDFKVKTDEKDVYLTGYANTKNKADRYGDIPTVFSEKRNYVYDLKEFKKNPVMLLDHSYSVNNIAGSFEVIKEDEKGLYFEAKFSNSELPQIRHAKEIYLEGHAKALSIGGMWKYEDDKNPNHLTLARIYEISLVAVPADPNALAIAMEKALKEINLEKPLSKTVQEEIENLKTLKDINNYLKDNGFSKIQTEGVMAKMREVIKQGKPITNESKSQQINLTNLFEANINNINKLIDQIEKK